MQVNAPNLLRTAFGKFRLFATDIKLTHTLFALPFALLSTFLAAGGLPPWGKLALILLCMVTARTVAMSANRLLDAELDAKNPRTATRAIPSGRLSRRFVLAMLAGCALAFLFATALFDLFYANPWPLRLSIPVLLFIAAYPLLKRFTRLCHYYLGAALALAPVCAWIAVAGTIHTAPLLMAGAVLMWTAGFDIIYACQDYHSDIENRVFSVPAKLGIGPALLVSRLTHLTCALLLIALGLTADKLGLLYFLAVGVTAALLIIEHALVSKDDLSKVGLAFFTLNGIISLLLGTFGILDVLRR